jgi:hypothetical protein
MSDPNLNATQFNPIQRTLMRSRWSSSTPAPIGACSASPKATYDAQNQRRQSERKRRNVS